MYTCKGILSYLYAISAYNGALSMNIYEEDLNMIKCGYITHLFWNKSGEKNFLFKTPFSIINHENSVSGWAEVETVKSYLILHNLPNNTSPCKCMLKYVYLHYRNFAHFLGKWFSHRWKCWLGHQRIGACHLLAHFY